MGIKQLFLQSIKKPRHIPLYLKDNTRLFWSILVNKRVPFNFDDVVTNLGIKGADLPQFSARLYSEVRLLKEAIGDYRSNRSLEIGCGYGRLSPWIAEVSNEHYAIDPEITLLNCAKKLYPAIRFRQAKVQKLPFPNGYFDLCVSWTVLQHIPPAELTKGIEEIKRVCSSEAMIVLCEGQKKIKVENYWQRAFSGYWGHTLNEWKVLFTPWKPTWYTERKLEETYEGIIGLVIRLENIRPK